MNDWLDNHRFGLWKVGTTEAPDVVYEAIKAGYRLFDCAYGKMFRVVHH